MKTTKAPSGGRQSNQTMNRSLDCEQINWCYAGFFWHSGATVISALGGMETSL
jgi:hypothetical protein